MKHFLCCTIKVIIVWHVNNFTPRIFTCHHYYVTQRQIADGQIEINFYRNCYLSCVFSIDFLHGNCSVRSRHCIGIRLSGSDLFSSSFLTFNCTYQFFFNFLFCILVTNFPMWTSTLVVAVAAVIYTSIVSASWFIWFIHAYNNRCFYQSRLQLSLHGCISQLWVHLMLQWYTCQSVMC